MVFTRAQADDDTVTEVSQERKVFSGAVADASRPLGERAVQECYFAGAGGRLLRAAVWVPSVPPGYRESTRCVITGPLWNPWRAGYS